MLTFIMRSEQAGCGFLKTLPGLVLESCDNSGFRPDVGYSAIYDLQAARAVLAALLDVSCSVPSPGHVDVGLGLITASACIGLWGLGCFHSDNVIAWELTAFTR